MIKKMNKILGVIPARAGSRGIPNKNKKICASKPLIQWTIDSSKKSKLLNNIIITTDDPDIIKIAKKNNINVIIRPPELATDDSLIVDTLNYILDKIPDTHILVLLQPTSPIRNDGLIDKCIKKFLDGNYDCLVTGYNHCRKYEKRALRRQEMKPNFFNDGNVFVFKPEKIREGKTVCKNYGKVYTSKEENVDIDDEFDFWLAEKILEKKYVKKS